MGLLVFAVPVAVAVVKQPVQVLVKLAVLVVFRVVAVVAVLVHQTLLPQAMAVLVVAAKYELWGLHDESSRYY
jgi:hypothetical protein